MSLYSIKDLEHLSGIKAHTLRVWEQRYQIVQPKRTDTNIRYYDDMDLKLILNISLLKEHGYKISNIAKMSREDMKEKVIFITDNSNKCPDQVQALTIAMIDLDEERFEKIISTSVIQSGFEKTMIQVIYPFLIRIGFLWQTGAVSPAQEHFISNLIRQKIIVAIDGQVVDSDTNVDKYMLFLPEGELHELSLLFSSYIIKSRGNKSIYLGQTLPFNDLVAANKIHEPQYILTIATTNPSQESIQEYLDKLGQAFPNQHLLLSGYQIVAQDLDIPENATVINKIEDLIDFVEINSRK